MGIVIAEGQATKKGEARMTRLMRAVDGCLLLFCLFLFLRFFFLMQLALLVDAFL